MSELNWEVKYHIQQSTSSNIAYGASASHKTQLTLWKVQQ
jgi:hypothetical protein